MKGNSPAGQDLSKGLHPPDEIRIIQDEMKKLQFDLENRLYGPNAFPDGNTPGNERIVEVHRTSRGFKVSLAARHFYDPEQSK